MVVVVIVVVVVVVCFAVVVDCVAEFPNEATKNGALNLTHTKAKSLLSGIVQGSLLF